MSAVEAVGLRRSFGSVVAVDDVDLVVEPGAVLAVLGPSGCGKTTLLRLLAGFVVPERGSLALDGRPVASAGRGLAPEKRPIGLVAQDGALFPHLRVGANIGYGLPRSARTPARIAELLGLVGLDVAMASRRPDELSGGQQQRVAVARALAPEPSLLLLDEPFSSLDAGLRLETGRAVVAAVRARGATAVLVTHDQDEALSLADRVAVMHRGRIVQIGTPAEVYARPATPFVAGFVGDGSLQPGFWSGGTAHTAVGDVAVAAEGPGTGTVLLRPEQVGLLERSPDGREVLAADFRGSDGFVRLAVEGGPELVARVDPGRLPRPGERWTVGLRGTSQVFGPDA